MGLFSRKGKSLKDEVKADDKKEEEKPKMQDKQTAAVNSASQGSRSDNYMERRRMENLRRLESSQYDNAPSNASFSQETALHGTPSGPPSPNAQRAALGGMYSEYGSYTSSVAPSFKNRSSYFANSSTNGKQPASTGYYSDSGYESAEPISAMHSRVPSEHNLYDSSKVYYSQNTTLPVLALSGENPLEAEIAANSKGIGNVSPLDLNSDARSIKSNISVGKRTRFEDDAEPMPALHQLEQHRKDSGEETREQSQHAQPVKILRGGSLPPLSILDGFKVNKKGKILDEEGEAIGELVEGDLLECVRQKANANGEVVDEYGRVVGQVRTCAAHVAPAVIAPMQHATAVPVTNTQTSDIAPMVTAPQPTAPQPVQQPEVVAKPDPAPVHSETSLVATEQKDEPRSEPVSEPAVQPTISQPVAVPQLSLPTTQDSKRMSRSASERSLSELSKPYARPTMSSVPEHNVPDDDAIPASPTLYAYKGEIPVTDGVQQNKRRSRSPPYPIQNPKALPGPGQYAKSALVGGHAGNTLFPPMRPVGMSSRTNRQPLHSAMKKSAVNSYVYDTTPNGSDSGSDPSSSDDGRMLTFGAHSRNSSMHTVGTMSKPRTYFTHAGKVTIDPGTSTESETPAPAKAAPAAAPAPAEKKKKSRMSMSFGKKSKVAA